MVEGPDETEAGVAGPPCWERGPGVATEGMGWTEDGGANPPELPEGPDGGGKLERSPRAMRVQR